LDKQAAVLADQSIQITASVGVASFDELSDAEVLARADIALYSAKQEIIQGEELRKILSEAAAESAAET